MKHEIPGQVPSLIIICHFPFRARTENPSRNISNNFPVNAAEQWRQWDSKVTVNADCGGNNYAVKGILFIRWRWRMFSSTLCQKITLLGSVRSSCSQGELREAAEKACQNAPLHFQDILKAQYWISISREDMKPEIVLVELSAADYKIWERLVQSRSLCLQPRSRSSLHPGIWGCCLLGLPCDRLLNQKPN